VIKHQTLFVEVIVNGPFVENCFLVADERTRQAVLIDPGDEEERLLAVVRDSNLSVQQILCTHGHIDHAGAVGPLQRLLGAPFALHALERPSLANIAQQALMYGLSPREVPVVDHELTAGEQLQVGDLRAEVRFTPGHTAGGCCFYFPEQQVVFAGDTLFAGSIGRSDLPGGSARTLLDSIRRELFTLPDEVVVYCGHGPSTTMGIERRTNPFLLEP
jgi:hydroxyacylglutathione hydrolase